ncbi:MULTISPECIES: hypothetical protein [Geobacter]|uniref:hypothetical protein n=1 Tax=Geobacter TaxID=28231 RepID=UPI002572B35E|nr:hypothetical protein [Geobacter sulfurreducens]BEH10697.1 hypothetical protein GSUET_23090 [Geobacter sulfurreducens subsp. ethanolicus]BET58542.1 hypothetical protein GEO60473_15820 [Geobacter sp. 60473]HML79556.1 hypothetical protein [Geobacter sulfurreducens]
MEDVTLVMQSEVKINGTTYPIHVYRREDGHCFAVTHLKNGDIIINDGETQEEALARQEGVLPLAVGSRVILDEFRRSNGLLLKFSH